MARFTTTKPVLVTGATGTINTQLIPQLLSRGARVRALVHTKDKGKELSDRGVEVIVGSFENPASLEKAFAGVERVFLVTPPHPDAAEWVGMAIAAARKAGRPYIVRLSVIRADEDGPTDNVRQHGRTEKDLDTSGLPFAVLRPHFFMQNLFMGAQTIGSEGVFYMGMGDGRMGLIDARDIADSALALLADPSNAGKVHEITGPASITFHEVAAAFGEALGREVRYVPVPPAAVADSIRKMGLGDWFAEVMKDYSAAYARGWGDFTTDTVRELTGHESRSIAQFAREVLAPALSQSGRGEVAAAS